MVSTMSIHHARIWTGCDHLLQSGIRIDGDRVAELLPTGSIPPAGPSLDLGGKFITPGLIDAHMHVLAGGTSMLQVDLSRADSRDAFEACLEEAHQQLPENQWLIAGGWSENRWDPPVLPDHSWLRCCGTRPVVCWRMDLHAAVVNNAVLEVLDLPDDSTVEKAGGRIGRDADGQPSGLLQEAAAWQYLIPRIPPPDSKDLARGLALAHRHCAGLGLTSIRTLEYRRDLELLIDQSNHPDALRTSLAILDRELPLDLGWLHAAPRSNHFRITGAKSFVDGTLGSRSARLLQPYADNQQNHGLFTEHALDGTLSEWVEQVRAADLTPVLHAIGDAAVMTALAATVGGEATIEHAEVVTETVLDSIAARPGCRLSMQPLHRADDAVFAHRALGVDRARYLSPFRDLRTRGARLAFGSDWPVVSCDPVAGMEAAILGRDSNGQDFHVDQCLDPEETLRAYTTDAAEQAGLPEVGRLRRGAFADFVVWSEDPREADWVHRPPRIEATFIGGRQVAGKPLGGKR